MSFGDYATLVLCVNVSTPGVYKSINVLLLIRIPVGVTFIITRNTPGRDGVIAL